MKTLWPSGQKMTMREFIGDKRLVKWYTQNYDMVGNTSFTSSDIDIVADRDIIAEEFKSLVSPSDGHYILKTFREVAGIEHYPALQAFADHLAKNLTNPPPAGKLPIA